MTRTSRRSLTLSLLVALIVLATPPPQITPFGMGYAIHDALVRPYPGYKMGPSLAESWKQSRTARRTSGDLSKAIPVLERGLRLCQSAQLSLFFPRLASALGLAYAQSGRLAEGLPLLEQAVEQSAAMQIVLHHTLWLIHLSEGHRLAGRLDEAAHGAIRALELARAYQERAHQAYALRLLGEVAAHRAGSRPQAQ